MENEQTPVESYGFKAEIQQLLYILAHSLYKDRDIFLRELISNASDALTRYQFETLTNQDVVDPDAELAIWIDTPKAAEGEPRRIIIRDTGIGMTRDELVRDLGTIAQSGARDFMARVKAGEVYASDVIGQFGVGFYSVFMVASEVRVVSRSYQPEATAAVWTSDGGDRFTVDPADKPGRGTEIHITLKPDAEELANAWRLKQIVKKYSDYVRFPIYVEGEQANQRESLWRKPASAVTVEQQRDFYRQMTMDFEEPLLTLHFSSDAPLNLRALLFVPARRDRGVLSLRREPGLMLYSHNVLIQEYCTDLLPHWLSFVDGVVDSEDLPLNVSRETVQNNRLMGQLGKTIKTRLLRELKKMGESEPEKYRRFWEEYGQVLKEGIASDPAAQEDITPLLRYQTTKSDGAWVSLDDVIGRMPDEQNEIYYVLADGLAAAAGSPHLDPFKAGDIEVMYWADPLDVFIAPLLHAYRGKALKSAASADLVLPEAPAPEVGEEGMGDVEAAEFEALAARARSVLGERVADVRESKVLRDSPIRLVAPADSPDGDMQRIYRMLGRDYQTPRRVLEINRRHPLIARLAALLAREPEAPLIDLSIEQLYASALMQEGLHPNPVEMLPRIQQLIELAVASEAPDEA